MKHFLLTTFVLLGCLHLWAVQPDKEYDVYLLIGQSNMAGRGKLEAKDTLSYIEGVWLLDSLGVPVKASAPLNRYSSIRKEIGLQGYNLGYSFAQQIRRRTGRDILLVVNARGGSSVVEWQPGDEHRYYEEAVRRTKQALKHGTLRGILWHQGETDVAQQTPDYIGLFTHLITSLRKDLQAEQVPVVVGQLGQWRWNKPDRIRCFNDSIIPQLCRSVSQCRYVKSHGLERLYINNERDPHFSRKAQKELGRRYADVLQSFAQRRSDD